MILLWNICLISPYSFGFVRLPKIFILLQLVGGVGAMLCCSFKSKGIYRNSLNRVEHELKNWNSKYSRYFVYIGMPITVLWVLEWLVLFFHVLTPIELLVTVLVSTTCVHILYIDMFCFQHCDQYWIAVQICLNLGFTG